MNDLERGTRYPEQFHSFDFEQDYLKGPQGNSNVLFDEIDGLECILTSLKYVIQNIFDFGTERTFGYIPLLRDLLSCKTTFLLQKGGLR